MSGGDDDLWAATRPDGVGPVQPDDGAGAGHNDSSAADPEPTRVQPAIRMGLGTPAGGGNTQSPGGNSTGDGRPPWLVPAAIGLAVVLIGGLFVAFAAGGDEDDDTALPDTSTSTSLTTTTAPESAVATITTNDRAASDVEAAGDDANAGSTTVDSTAPTTDESTPPTEPPASDDDSSTGGDNTGGDAAGDTGGDTADEPTDPGTDTNAPSESTVASTTPPATAAPGDDEPDVTPPDPGFAAYGDERLAIESSCRELPRGPEGDEVSSFLVRSPTDGRVVVEQRVAGDQVAMDVRYPDIGEVVTASGVRLADGATFGQVTRDGTSLDVAVATPPGGVEECLDFIELVPSNDVDARGYTAGILDVCTADTPSGRAISGIATDNTSFTAVPTGDTTRLTIVVPSLGGTLVDDDALADRDETIVFYEGVVTGAGEPQAAYLEVELESPRVCTASEAP
ncbi:MAG: hypothetical protein AAGA42_18725 [Actinomycetota bacterium]